MTDNEVIEYLKSKKTIRYKRLPKEISEFLLNRYSDSSGIRESVYRLLNNIDIRPVCQICGGYVKTKPEGGFNTCCSSKCIGKLSANKRMQDPNYQSPFKNKAVREKIKRTLAEKYGVDNIFRLKETHEKSKQTKIDRYGDPNYNNVDKFKKTCLERYGVEVPAKNKEIRQKQITTSIERYGGVFHKEKVSATIKEKYGVDWYTETNHLKTMSTTISTREKQYATKRKNKSFNSSIPENSTCAVLSTKYPDTITQYSSSVYPFNCDFYIPSLDLYIECNYHWTHGGHPYDKDKDKEQLEYWKSKNSKFYNNAIQTWTVRDAKKLETAKTNNLNYIVFYTYEEFIRWFENL